MIRVNVGRLAQLNRLSGELLTNQNRQTAEIGQAQKIIREVLQLVQTQQHTLNTIQDWADQRRFTHSYATLKNGPSKNGGLNGGLKSSVEPSLVGDRLSGAPVAAIAPLGTLLQFDTLEFDHYSELDLLLQSALERRTQIETQVETLSLLIQQSGHSLEKQQRLLTEVRDDLTWARMQPLGEVLNRFQRVLQQLTTARHKPVTLSLQGADVLIERAIADKLYDPLLHLIRNAFDHGIETPEIRHQLGKPATGQIQIRAHQKGNRTVIEVQDDGKGIDFQSIRQRAIELNRLSPKQAGQLSEAQLVELLFEPGFSTASKLTDLSGRGIGLDVVLSQIRALNGSVTVQSQLQQGTTFSLHLPSTLTITKLMLCHANGMTYALTVDVIDQIVLPNPDQVHRLNGQKALSWRKGNTEYLIPIWKLSDLVVYSTQTSPAQQTSRDPGFASGLRLHQSTPQSAIVLLKQANQILGLEVDHVLGEQELVIRPLSKSIASPPYIYGGSILSDSRLALVIDPVALITNAAGTSQLSASGHDIAPASLSPIPPVQALPAAAKSEISVHPGNASVFASPKKTSRPTVLVVDDSATIRQTLSLLLQQSGYHVLQAMDGMEALEHLQQHIDHKLSVICDLEMPRMNGFEFLNRCRQSSSLSQIPVIILTSRSGDKHRQLALELGAVAYLTKPYMPSELLTLLTQTVNAKR